MKDVTAAVTARVTVQDKTEVIWDEIRSKVVIFSDGEPVSFESLDPSENREDLAVNVAVKLVLDEGVKL